MVSTSRPCDGCSLGRASGSWRGLFLVMTGFTGLPMVDAARSTPPVGFADSPLSEGASQLSANRQYQLPFPPPREGGPQGRGEYCGLDNHLTLRRMMIREYGHLYSPFTLKATSVRPRWFLPTPISFAKSPHPRPIISNWSGLYLLKKVPGTPIMPHQPVGDHGDSGCENNG